MEIVKNIKVIYQKKELIILFTLLSNQMSHNTFARLNVNLPLNVALTKNTSQCTMLSLIRLKPCRLDKQIRITHLKTTGIRRNPGNHSHNPDVIYEN